MAAIKTGAKGPEVVLLQGILQKLDFPITSDGIFGADTEEAVKQFQNECGLDVDGAVGQNTADSLVRALHFGREEVRNS